ncbi:HTH domain-containing protein [Candidatus Pacearchaeota archaeon]|nr:HTH domain-containing protein [Candidatus Pacearchaeota archaeon]
MKNSTSHLIVEYVKKKKQVTAKELSDYLEITPRAVFKQLKKLVEINRLTKIGQPPKVFYLLAEDTKHVNRPVLSNHQNQLLDERFFWITPLGNIEKGVSGFSAWCTKFGLAVAKTAGEYEKTLQKYDKHKKDGVISGLQKMKKTFPRVYLDELYYLDFYAIERFGKTKLGQFLLYAKQSQNRAQIKELSSMVKARIQVIIKKHSIDAVGFIPPTVKREIQFMKELEKHLRVKQPCVSIVKVKTPVVVPQKTLNKIEDRVENARRTLIVDEKREYKNILLIDDAVGSGATLNETAKQIKDKQICRGTLIGLAITGSFKGFDVISEV